MTTKSEIRERAKSVLRDRLASASDEDGYVESIEDNLLPGVELGQFEDAALLVRHYVRRTFTPPFTIW